MPSNMAANTNDATLLKNQSVIKYLPEMPFFSNFGCKIIFICSVNFWHQQDTNSLFKGSIAWSCDLLVQVQDSSSLHLTFVVFCLLCVIRKQKLKENNHCVCQSINQSF